MNSFVMKSPIYVLLSLYSSLHLRLTYYKWIVWTLVIVEPSKQQKIESVKEFHVPFPSIMDGRKLGWSEGKVAGRNSRLKCDKSERGKR